MAKKLNLKSFNAQDFKSEVRREEHNVCARVLIVCEGTKTEPKYFESFPAMQYGGKVVDIKCEGTATNTLQVVQMAIKLQKKAISEKKPFDSVWAVFDRDSFKPQDFDTAITLAKSKGIGCAWSNEAFELWYIYHFEDRQTAMSRKDYQARITTHLSKHIPGYQYQKNDPAMLSRLRAYGDEPRAIERARNGLEHHAGKAPHDMNPATTVFRIVELLTGKDRNFNEKIKKKLTEGKEQQAPANASKKQKRAAKNKTKKENLK